jgi:hypothetical protein
VILDLGISGSQMGDPDDFVRVMAGMVKVLDPLVSPEYHAGIEPGVRHWYDPVAGPLRVDLFNQSGRLIRTLLKEGVSPSGVHIVHLAGSGLTRKPPSGAYLYQVQSIDESKAGKVVILK